MAANMLRDGKQNAANIAYAVGFNSEAAFNRAFKREYGEPPATWRRRVEEGREGRAQEAQRPGLPQQVVRYRTAKDGTRLAYSVIGEGPPLVKTANWLNHIEHDWKSPLWRHWIAGVHRRPLADPLRRARQRHVRLGHAGDLVRRFRRRPGMRRRLRRAREVRPARRSARARRSRSLMPCATRSGCAGW